MVGSRSARITADAEARWKRDVRDRQAENGAGVKIELVQILREQRDHAGVVRPRRKLREDHIVAGHEKFDPEDSAAAEVVDHLRAIDCACARARGDIAAGCQLSR